MHCMKCGREIEEGQVFCIECLKDMARYPVRPGTAVHLPKRPAYSPIRRTVPKRKTIPAEDMVKRQRRIIRRLSWALVITSILAALMAYPTITHLLESEDFPIGQNFSVIEDFFPVTEETE